jgi:hypothetical protein
MVRKLRARLEITNSNPRTAHAYISPEKHMTCELRCVRVWAPPRYCSNNFCCWHAPEGPIRRPERGEWMEADKNSSPNREFGLGPKFTTKDSHMRFPRSRNHNGPSNPRNKPQTIPKRKWNSRSKELSSSAQHQADRPQAPGGPSARPRRTIRGAGADCPKTTPNLQYCTLTNGPSVEIPRIIRDLNTPTWTVRGPQADRPPNTLQLKTARKTERNQDTQEQATNTKNTKPAGSTRTVRGLQADCPPGTNRTTRTPNHEVNLSYPSKDLPNGLSSWGKIWGRCEASLGDAMPQNLGPQTN